MTRGHRPRARFSQNFLHDQNIIGRIVSAIGPLTSDSVVEIGPGEGALTRPLLQQLEKLTVIELDRDLAARLREIPGVDVREGDSQDIDLSAMGRQHGQPLRLVGNLPYNITTPLLFHALAHRYWLRDMHFLLQREVVERLAAAPGGRDYGRLSVMVQYQCRVEPLFRVPAGAFRPAPRVTSQLVRLTPHTHAPVSVTDEAVFEDIVAQAFKQRRKTLRNALSSRLSAGEIEAAGISPSERAEQLSLKDFAALANAHSARRSGELG